jgi:hypothetical protein
LLHLRLGGSRDGTGTRDCISQSLAS